MSKNYIQIDAKDNIIVAITALSKGTVVTIAGKQIVLQQDIKQKHKFALHDFNPADKIFMYGVLIGKATTTIKAGSAITTENIKHASSDFTNQKKEFVWSTPNISKFKDKTFNGYHRKDGKVGTANYWLVIPLTFCENRNIDVIEAALAEKLGYQTKKDFAVDTDALIKQYKARAHKDDILNTPIITSHEEMAKNRVFPNVDGIKFLKHDGGCGGIRQDSETLCKLLAGYICNPNVAGATILSLGCQNAQISMMQEAILAIDPSTTKPVYYLEQQRSLSERNFIEEAVKHTFLGLIEANKITRKPAPLHKLVLGLECGGSDGFSGISANPALGYASDLLVALGGSPVLAEFPELNGVEQEIINRCVTEEDSKKFYNLMRAYSAAAVAVGSGFENNPSPGNIKDGLITDAMKSAGAAKKGGTSPVVSVLDYTEQVTKPGLNLLCTPGNDVESTTGLVGSGCNVVVFTTGLGTPTGNPVAPVLKMSSNTNLYQRMQDIIDINAGTVISGEDTIETMGEKILEHIIKVASGELASKAVIHGNNDFIPWKRGVSL
ncbi:Altronate dehydratase [Cellulophaga lytica DSM 7489]|uniref:Altronate dehydratase n=1 Tax=Cellulophaga lytica (strain ATCC 23178 / DSM 7489 / JCM 8516 / NBRC 14961 / NCIMB 1423 / VKM B-1433 / Cy l20) TaxID=867900 RepID=F0RIC9_CELLC|nr:altronate dehydratase family protein [Cellulophaga lytica]ADY28255.1 Altronate dehydratase [Cellulophaga lytica DSM 7489]WQG77564.1 altronate dehydratase family protein [Cellulophaga lytica]